MQPEDAPRRLPFEGALTLHAPAKINLALHLRGRRSDGYHELESLFLPLEWGDTLDLRAAPASEEALRCRCDEQPELATPHNLALAAARRWLTARRYIADVELRLHKKVWLAAGLGGGSSDAAAVLRGLEALASQAGLAPLTTLPELALGLGADVPFFLAPRPALARGIGEVLIPVGAPPASLHLVLVNPGRPLSTAAVFEAVGIPRGERRPGPPLPSALPPTVGELASLLHNDLEPAATRLCPEIPRMRAALLAAGALGASLSGSGPTVFGLFESAPTAEAAAASISTIHGFSAVSTRVLDA